VHERGTINQVPFVFRSATNEILYMSHLDTVNARWSYDIMWAAGLYSTYDLFFAAIDEKTREVRRRRACCVARGNARIDERQLHAHTEKIRRSCPLYPPQHTLQSHHQDVPHGRPCEVLKYGR
jgi:hypothetical protein